MFRYVAITFSIILIIANSSFAEVSSFVEDRSTFILIRGEITSQTADDFISTYNNFLNDEDLFPPLVSLNSEGGSIDAAIRIGRYLRDQKAHASVPLQGKCFSSCVLIYSGAVNRTNYGKIGLHRPYIHAFDSSQRSSESEIRAMYTGVRNYLREMGIHDELYRFMMVTPPEDMLIFERGDQDLLRLIPKEDPVYSEMKLQDRAFQIGISTSEIRRRDAWAEENCYALYSDLQDQVTCFEAARWGLDVKTFRTRSSEAHTLCQEEVGQKWESWPECQRQYIPE